MDTVTIIVIASIISMFLLGIVLMIVLIKKARSNSTRAYFIYDDNNIQTKRYKRINQKFEYESKTYLYDEKFALKKIFSQHIFYYVGSPNPIDFSQVKNKKIEISSQNLNKLLKDDLISKLFGTQDALEKIQGILILLTIILTAVTLFMVFQMKNQGVELAQSQLNRDFIISAVKQAISGV